MDMSSRFCMDLRYSKHTSINFLNGFLVIFRPFRHIHFMGYLPIVVATVVNRVLFMHLCKLDWANLHIWLNRFYGIIVGWCWCSWNEGKISEKFEECSTIIIILMWYTRVNSLPSFPHCLALALSSLNSTSFIFIMVELSVSVYCLIIWLIILSIQLPPPPPLSFLPAKDLPQYCFSVISMEIHCKRVLLRLLCVCCCLVLYTIRVNWIAFVIL